MDLCIPPKILEQHVVGLGKTGAGKSSMLRHIVEYLLSQKKRVCVVDPKGDWWGLKSSADGKGPGFPVIAFGDFKEERASDVPINDKSGRHVAELIASGNRPCIIGFRGWHTSHMVRFWIDFAAGIFSLNQGELYLVGDEFHNFAPKGGGGRAQDPETGWCLHWSNRLLSEGRGLGIVCLIASQRPQKVHNDTLTSCETLIAMRVIHKADRDAVQDWIEGCGDISQGKEVLNSLAGMKRGEAYVWSPEAGFGPQRVQFPLFTTFDSFAPPQLQKKVSQAGWAGVDLAAVKEKLARVIEEAKANDPSELKREISKLKAELAKKPNKVEQAPTPKAKEVPVLTDTERTRLTKLISSFDKLYGSVEGHLSALRGLGEATNDLKPEIQFIRSKLQPTVAQTPTAQRAAQPSYVRQIPKNFGAEQTNGDWKPSKCARAILTVLAQSGGSSRRKISLSSGYSIKSSGFANALSELRTHAAIEGSDTLKITELGAGYLGDYVPLPTGCALQEHWINRLGKCPSALLSHLVRAYPSPLTREELASASGYSESSSGFANSVSELRGLELIEDVSDRRIKAAADLFE